ncbi:MAG: hypothetical protein JHC26_11860 [Thermofilum sp.]|uniref:hypothetical protein n=1 Tax=Thermofilum sp. TaxID=1961369 RepID=UPI002590404E|nr:hypothetical protein [Thermofilum sp.]MCI4409779.1 hypothetical protein [Thermofilum sp.]
MSRKSTSMSETTKLDKITFILMIIALIAGYVVFTDISNYCRDKYKDDLSFIAEVDEILRKDPTISNALRNNTYTIDIVDVKPSFYIDKYSNIECKPWIVTIEVRLEKPVFIVLHGPTNQYLETQIIRADIKFGNWTVVSYGDGQPGYIISYTSP